VDPAEEKAATAIGYMRRFLTEPAAKPSEPRVALWLALSFLFAGFYAYQGLVEGFSGRYVVQDDARQHIFWMQRFVDPGLFPNDLIADYYESISPSGFTTLYWIFGHLGVEPLLLTKILPLVLGLAATAYSFAVTMRVLPVPAAGFAASLLLNQVLWSRLDLVSSTPRAFLCPLFLAFLYHFLRRSLIGCVVTVALLGLFYPSGLFIAAGVVALNLFRLEKRRLRVSQNRGEYFLCAAVLVVASLATAAYWLQSSRYGPPITASEGRMLPTGLAGERLGFLDEEFWTYWLWGEQSGLLSSVSPMPFALIAGLLLPVLMYSPKRFPLASRITGAKLLPLTALASVIMFFAAHAVLFRLYLPDRYIRQTVPMLICVAAGVGLLVMLDAVLRWSISSQLNKRVWVAAGATALVGAMLVSFPSFVKRFPRTKWRAGEEVQLYEFLSRQPKDSVIATLSREANNIPTFAKRSVLIAPEYANPYQRSYYLQLHERCLDLLNAQYTTDSENLRNFIREYHVDFFVLDRNAFEPSYLQGWITRRFRPTAVEIKKRLERGDIPVMAKVMRKCVVLETGRVIVLRAADVEEAAQR